MKRFMPHLSMLGTTILLSMMSLFAFANPNTNASNLIVVQDNGGVSALPYYEELGLTVEPVKTVEPLNIVMPESVSNSRPISRPVSIEAMLPVRSELLTPGQVVYRSIQAPKLPPFFMIGDDDLSQRWLIARKDTLQSIGAMGLVVNVISFQRFNELQALVPDLKLSPVSGDDIATRLGLAHYPVLITSTAIEQ